MSRKGRSVCGCRQGCHVTQQGVKQEGTVSNRDSEEDGGLMIQWSLGEAVVPSQHRWPEDAAGTPVQGRGQRGGCRRLESLDGSTGQWEAGVRGWASVHTGR